ncbi:MAG: DUF3105 domain-containing protein, partial [Chloroflexi bacterium]|nr:DUF3105 domain-containing protein [Chloroflexota bacterium]
MTLDLRRDRRAKERRTAKGRRSAGPARPGPRIGNAFVRPVIVAVLIFAAVLGLRASGAFDPGPPKLDPNDARFNPAGQVVGVKQKDEGRGHVANDKTVSYGTTPPTSGDHWDTPAAWGSYDRQQPNERTVHNLEHGGIVVSYNGLTPDDEKQLKAVVSQLRSGTFRKILIQPYPTLN